MDHLWQQLAAMDNDVGQERNWSPCVNKMFYSPVYLTLYVQKLIRMDKAYEHVRIHKQDNTRVGI